MANVDPEIEQSVLVSRFGEEALSVGKKGAIYGMVLLPIIFYVLFTLEAYLSKGTGGTLFLRVLGLGYLALTVYGFILGFQDKAIVFYDKMDAFSAFLPLLGTLGAGILVFIFQDVTNDFIMGLVVTGAFLFFTYNNLKNAVTANASENLVVNLSVICVRLFLGILYPIFIYLRLTEGSKTGSIYTLLINMLLTALGGFLIMAMVNGPEVELERNSNE